MATVKIQIKESGEVKEFSSLDKALRTLQGVDSKGYRFGKTLLTKPGLMSYRTAHRLIDMNGYTLVQRAKNVKLRKVYKDGKVTEVEMTKEEIYKEAMEMIMKMFFIVNQTQMTSEEIDTVRVELDKAESTDKVVADHADYFVKALGDEYSKVSADSKEGKALKAKMLEIPNVINEEKSEEQAIEAAKDAEAEKERKKKEKEELEKYKDEHMQFPILLKVIAAKVNALLVGPAGSGKTTAADHVAKSLNLSYYSISVGMQTTKTEFFGYMDATGRYVRTLFREAYEKGGLFLIDELDAGNANVMTAMNQALANDSCAFPDGMVAKHPEFCVVASANTFGTGANREYVGRNQLDAATLDRFAVINWEYDNTLENKNVKNKTWLKFVLKCRDNANKYKIRTVVSPRASYYGDAMIAGGMSMQQAADLLVKKGVNESEYVKLTEGTSL